VVARELRATVDGKESYPICCAIPDRMETRHFGALSVGPPVGFLIDTAAGPRNRTTLPTAAKDCLRWVEGGESLPHVAFRHSKMGSEARRARSRPRDKSSAEKVRFFTWRRNGCKKSD
jgi:hypothetical protein